MQTTIRELEMLPATAEQRPTNALTPMDMVDRAITSGANIEIIGKMMDFQERWEKNQARKAFDEAMAAAKSEIPVILKNREVDFTSQKGRTHYRYEDLAGIARQIDPILAKHGLSYRFRTATETTQVLVTCIVSHRLGHSEENSLSAGRDESGNKNNIQAVGSSITYLQRYTLKAALGLSASEDDDGAAITAGEKITEEQVQELNALMLDVKADTTRFLKYFKLESLADLPAKRFKEATDALNAKRGK